MEDGGVVDDMMQAVLPWRSDEEKMMQFMEETLGPRSGPSWSRVKWPCNLAILTGAAVDSLCLINYICVYLF